MGVRYEQEVQSSVLTVLTVLTPDLQSTVPYRTVPYLVGLGMLAVPPDEWGKP